MKVTKKVVGELEKCYSLEKLYYRGKDHFLVAAEKNNRCMLFDYDGNYVDTIWDQPGGVMSMVQVPETDGQFLATHRFYSPNDSQDASIVFAYPAGDNGWTVQTLAFLPFVHRFDILQAGPDRYLIACTIKSDHQYKDDWSSPGRIYACRLPEDLTGYHAENPLPLTMIKDGLQKNHGFCKYIDKNQTQSAVISCQQGIFICTPPSCRTGEWGFRMLLDEPASDALLLDIDQDGEDELIVLTPFHGNQLKIYKKENNGFHPIYSYPEKLDFLHAIWGGMLYGQPAVIIGNRNDKRLLLSITCDKQGTFLSQILDQGCGAANVLHIQNRGKDLILAANREVNEIAMYTLEP